jgi:NitT/TauT family transport system ATP-binding protein
MNLLVQRIWLEARSTVVLVTHNIDEAVFLADRIAVMTPRPGRIFEIVENQLPRPRSAESYRDPLFSEQANHLRDIIGIGRSDA